MFAVDHRSAPIPIYTPRAALDQADRLYVDDVKSPRSTISQLPNSPPMSVCDIDESAFLLSAVEDWPEIVPDVRGVSATQLAAALEQLSSIPLPSSTEMFPWLHGIHASNRDQMEFFDIASNPLAPRAYRGIILVHATAEFDGHLGRLKGSILSRDILATPSASGKPSQFLQSSPRWGIGLRNFHIQSAQVSLLSDIVVYDHNRGESDTDAALLLASRIAEAQRLFRSQQGAQFPFYNTFVVTDRFTSFERDFPHLVARTLDGKFTDNDPEFIAMEQVQMRDMSKAREISEGVWLGNSYDWTSLESDDSTVGFDIHIICDDFAPLPTPFLVKQAIDELSSTNVSHLRTTMLYYGTDFMKREMCFVASGCFGTPNTEEQEAVLDLCAWIYSQTHIDEVDELAVLSQAHMTVDIEATSSSRHVNSEKSVHPERMVLETQAKGQSSSAKRILISCKDGYTETSLFALLYTMYANCMTADEAWLSLHRDKRRGFYTFPEDIITVETMMPGLIRASPHSATKKSEALARMTAAWFSASSNGPLQQRLFTGSFPSRVLDHLYLGNLEHANNVAMLRVLGIERVLSVGEMPQYLSKRRSSKNNKTIEKPSAVMYIKDIQDDGIDSLKRHLEQCLDFIAEGLACGQTTLVHCRVGVSRSASICIAEVIRRLRISLEEAYILVRVRRLNVIIQPNLKFMYELLRWSQEELSRQAGLPKGELVPRSIEWPMLATKIAELNKLYIHR